MKRNISDIMHNADDETIERIADKKQAADSRTADRIYRKCISRLGTDAEQVEVFEAETVRRAPRFYPVFAAVFCLIIICGSVAAMLKFKAHAPLPEDNDPQIMATVTTATVRPSTVLFGLCLPVALTQTGTCSMPTIVLAPRAAMLR